MLKFLLSKFKEAPGPLKQTRLVAGDLAEEVLDLVEHYLHHGRNGSGDGTLAHPLSPFHNPINRSENSITGSTDYSKVDDSGSKKTTHRSTSVSTSSKKATTSPPLQRTIDAPKELEIALDNPKNWKKQEFKILAILWDARERHMGTLSAKEVSDRGVLLGLAIRHENVRKVLRMRLGKYVDTLTEQIGNNRIYRYKISEVGSDYFTTKYLHQEIMKNAR